MNSPTDQNSLTRRLLLGAGGGSLITTVVGPSGSASVLSDLFGVVVHGLGFFSSLVTQLEDAAADLVRDVALAMTPKAAANTGFVSQQDVASTAPSQHKLTAAYVYKPSDSSVAGTGASGSTITGAAALHSQHSSRLLQPQYLALTIDHPDWRSLHDSSDQQAPKRFAQRYQNGLIQWLQIYAPDSVPMDPKLLPSGSTLYSAPAPSGYTPGIYAHRIIKYDARGKEFASMAALSKLSPFV